MSYVVSFVYTFMVFSSIHQYDCHIFGGIDLFSRRSLVWLLYVQLEQFLFCIVLFRSLPFIIA